MEVNCGQEITYTLLDKGEILMKDNHVGLKIAGISSNSRNGYVSHKIRQNVKETIHAPLYKFPEYQAEYNSLYVAMRSGVNIEFRVFNEGMAYRFVTTSTKKVFIVEDETAEFNFTKDYKSYFPFSTNEKQPMAMAFQATYDVAPLSQQRHLEAFMPATVDCGQAKVTLQESDVMAYPGMFIVPTSADGVYSLRATFPRYPKSFAKYPWRQQMYVTETEDYIAKCNGKRNFPWRIAVVSHDDCEMPVNTMAYTLASSSRVKGDLSWVKPGRVAWDWWNDWGISGVDFKAGINQQTYKHYIDFAAENKLEYIILDEGWYVPSSGDMLTVIPELDLPALVEYGKSRNVGIILWTVFNVLDDQLEEACAKYSQMGIKGFKVDFLDRCDQQGVEMICRIAERCSQSKLLLDYHGIFTPNGINRTFPNIINYESVFGMEEAKWTNRVKRNVNGRSIEEPEKDMPLYDVTFPFIRMMSGFVDFTPGGFRNATKADFQPVYNNPMTMGTRCHQMAHYIVHDSPLTMLADNPTIYRREKECLDFLSSLPAIYDEMKVVSGKLGEYIVVARRSGNDWYLAGETNWDERTIELDSSFLPTGDYRVTLFSDGINAAKDATDYVVNEMNVAISHASSEKIKLNLASGGGFVAKLIRK